MRAGRPTRVGSAWPASGLTGLPGMALRREWGAESPGDGAGRRGVPTDRQQGWRGASGPVSPPRGEGHRPAFPLRGSASGREAQAKAWTPGPKVPPRLTRRSLQAFLASARALRAGRPSFSRQSPHTSRQQLPPRYRTESNKLGGTHTECSPLLNVGPVGKTSEKRSDSWRRDLCLLCISSRAW